MTRMCAINYTKHSFWLETGGGTTHASCIAHALNRSGRCHSRRRLFGLVDRLLFAARQSRLPCNDLGKRDGVPERFPSA
jgi:hypothetical protein